MTTVHHSPSLSPQSFEVPTSRSHRGAASSPGGGTSPFARSIPRSSPHLSPTIHSRARDGLSATRAGITASPRLVSRTGSTNTTLLSEQTPTYKSGVRTEDKEPQSSSSTSQTTKKESSGMRDASTQYTPDGLPPTAPTQPVPKITRLAEQAKQMAHSRHSSSTLGSSSSGDVFMGEAPASIDQLTSSVGPSPASGSVTGLARTASRDSQSITERTSRLRVNQAESSSNVSQAFKRNESPSEGSERSMDSVVNSLPSPTKRSRPNMPAPKKMPKNYMDCDLKELGIVISDMLMELIRMNDQIPPKEGSLTRFHSRAPPTISVRDYLNRLIVHATLSAPLLLTMVFYIDRLCTMYSAFTITSLTVHRFLITAATVAAKGLSDSFWTNHTYARVGGVSTKELAMLELDFLSRMDWTIVPNPDTLEDYYRSLIGRAEGYILEGSEDDK